MLYSIFACCLQLFVEPNRVCLCAQTCQIFRVFAYKTHQCDRVLSQLDFKHCWRSAFCAKSSFLVRHVVPLLSSSWRWIVVIDVFVFMLLLLSQSSDRCLCRVFRVCHLAIHRFRAVLNQNAAHTVSSNSVNSGNLFNLIPKRTK